MSAELYQPTVPEDYARLVVLSNPVATNRKHLPRYLDDLVNRAGFARWTVIDTEASEALTLEKMHDQLADEDLLYAAGGDGTVKRGIKYLSHPEAASATLLTSDLGDACNAHKGLFGKHFRALASDNFLHAVIKPLYPMYTTVEGPENYTEAASTTTSVGTIALGAYLLNQPARRTHPLRTNTRTALAYETYVSLVQTLPRSRMLELSEGPNRLPARGLAWIAINGPDVAKITKFDTQLDEHDFLFTTIASHQTALPSLFKMMRGTLPVARITGGEQAVSFVLDENEIGPAYIEFDGEAQRLQAGSRVTIWQPATAPNGRILKAVGSRD
jgi:hypothetical protein